jgi:hypothetical protein
MPRTIFFSVSAAAVMAASLAWADPVETATPEPDAMPAPAAVEPATPAETPDDQTQALSPDEMGAISAGDGTVVETLTTQQLNGATTGNSIVTGSLVSGAVNFSPTALSGFNGVGNFVINTGANNTLQGAINISVVTAPTP